MGKPLPEGETAEPPDTGSAMRIRMEVRQQLYLNLWSFEVKWGTAVPTSETHLSLGYGCYWAVQQPGCE